MCLFVCLLKLLLLLLSLNTKNFKERRKQVARHSPAPSFVVYAIGGAYNISMNENQKPKTKVGGVSSYPIILLVDYTGLEPVT